MRQKQTADDSKLVFYSIFLIIIFIGISLAIVQFFYNRSLWLDEAALALNIIHKDFIELLVPLDHNQVAPIGFLLLERMSVLIFGKNELALRLLPLIGFLFSVFLMYVFTRRVTGVKGIALMATSFFSINIMLIRYSNEVKQYSMDVLFVLIILYFTVSLQFNQRRSLIMYAILGSTAIWFSNASIIILAVAGIYILYIEGFRKENHKITFPLLFWAISFVVYYYFFIHNHPTSGMMTTYWKDAFLPLDPLSKEFYSFLFESVHKIYICLLGFKVPHQIYLVIPLLISFFGISYVLKEKRYTLLYFIVAPVALHLLLSAFKLYPFEVRLILYFTPLVTILHAVGLYCIFNFVNKKIKIPNIVKVLPVVIMLYPLYLQFPIQSEEIKKSLKHIEENVKNDDKVYVYNMALYAFNFYKDIEFITLKNKVVPGTLHRNHNEKYDHELLDLKGRVWLLFSHVYQDEEKYMIDLLVKHGAKLLDKQRYRGSSVYYIDTRGVE